MMCTITQVVHDVCCLWACSTQWRHGELWTSAVQGTLLRRESQWWPCFSNMLPRRPCGRASDLVRRKTNLLLAKSQHDFFWCRKNRTLFTTPKTVVFLIGFSIQKINNRLFCHCFPLTNSQSDLLCRGLPNRCSTKQLFWNCSHSTIKQPCVVRCCWSRKHLV